MPDPRSPSNVGDKIINLPQLVLNESSFRYCGFSPGRRSCSTFSGIGFVECFSLVNIRRGYGFIMGNWFLLLIHDALMLVSSDGRFLSKRTNSNAVEVVKKRKKIPL